MDVPKEISELRNRLTAVEEKIKYLVENYASQLVMERELGKLNLVVGRMEDSITNMSRRHDETNESLKTLFTMHSSVMQRRAEQDEELQKEKLEQQRTLFEERLQSERLLAAEKLSTATAEKDAIQKQAEERLLINRMRNWKFVVSFFVALIMFLGLIFGGFYWLVQYVQSHPK